MVNTSQTKSGAKWAALLALALSLGPAANAAQSLTVAWNPSTTPGITGYRIYYGDNGTNFQASLDAGTNTAYQVTGLPEGQTMTFAVKAYTTNDVESPASNLITYVGPGGLNVAAGNGAGTPATINFTVSPGYTYQVQASTNLTTWSTIWETTATNNSWTQFQDVEGTNLTMRFYRLAWH